MSNTKPTKEANILNQSLNNAGIETIMEYWDGYKHVDIYVPKGKLYIEIDEMQHYTSVAQISSDFRRDHYSELEGYRTFRLPSIVIEKKLHAITEAVLEIVNQK